MSPTTKPNPFSRPLDIRHILSTSPPPQDHVLPGLLAGTVGMLAGPGGVGKTMFELQVAMAVAWGGRICGGLFEGDEPITERTTQPGKVVLVVAEESVDVIWSRLHAVVATLFERPDLLGVQLEPDALLTLWAENLLIHPLAGMPRVTLMDRDLIPLESFQQLVVACEGARLVMLDPIRRFHTSDENDSGAMTALVQMLQQLSSKTKTAVIFVHHTNRASTQMGVGDTAGAARGSTALTDGVRWQLNLSQPTKAVAKHKGIADDDMGRFVMVDIAKSNYLPPQPTVMLERQAGGVLLRVDKVTQASMTSGSKLPAGKVKPRLKAVSA
jgi:RecA-family ATPase